MNDGQALLATIRATPDDDAPRLIYADWLDEQGDEARARFVRVQCRMATLEREHQSDLARFQRAVLSSPHPRERLRGDWPAWTHEFAQCETERQALLAEHGEQWIGKLDVLEDFECYASIEFHRGMLERLAIGITGFLHDYDAEEHPLPMLQELTIYGLRDEGGRLASKLDRLPPLRRLNLASWITARSAQDLARCPALASLESLTIWMGHEEDNEVVHALAQSAHLRQLKEFVVVQLYGGMQAGEVDTLESEHADSLTEQFNLIRGDTISRVERPYQRRFPFDGGNIERGLYAGYFPDGRAGLIAGRRNPAVLIFDSDGKLCDQVELGFDQLLQTKPDFEWEAYNENELLRLLEKHAGFRPAPIFVREFTSELAGLAVYLWGSYEDYVENPDLEDETGDDYESVCETLGHYWMHCGNFVVLYGNDYWAGPDGLIHTS